MDEADAKPMYEPLVGKERDAILQRCKENRGQGPFAIADILSGDLFGDDGGAKGYWHLLATKKPEKPRGRRGQWTPTTGSNWEGITAKWVWQDWGEIPAWHTDIANMLAAGHGLYLLNPQSVRILMGSLPIP